MDSADWDARYAATDLVWSSTPNQWVTEVLADLTPGRAVDIAAGEGRNAIWLAQQGWSVLALDFSAVAVERIRELAAGRLSGVAGSLEAAVADATRPVPGEQGVYDLVLFSYLQLPEAVWSAALRRGIEAAAPGGRVVVIAHARANLDGGWGGPQDPRVLHDPDDIVAQVDGLPVTVESAELRTRVVETGDGPREALDTVVVLRRA
jgi:SAM-dependent methyltransferase